MLCAGSGKRQGACVYLEITDTDIRINIHINLQLNILKE